MTEEELREKIAKLLYDYDCDHVADYSRNELSDQILDIPEIKEALEYMKLIRSGRFYDIEIKARLEKK